MDRIADYELLRSLGEGNHGTFYLARRPTRLPVTDEFVAVKVLAGRTSEETFRRATKELRAFAAVRSPYLVTLYDAGQEAGTFYYAMEYRPEGSLAVPARDLSRAHRLRAVADAARAVQLLHGAGLVHRDVKPANVLLTDTGGKLSDLGMAQLLMPGVTVTGMGRLDSIEYVDPAVLRGGRASPESDIWSLGATLHRAVAGSGIYGELPTDDPLLALRHVLGTEPRVDAALESPVADLVRACLDPSPAARPPSATVIAKALDDLVAK